MRTTYGGVARTGGREVELADFNGQTPSAEPPPTWATEPLVADRSPRRR